ncbi:MAG: hypothetical protein IT290_09860 [Deltaproteobacteria bacterium]|nr:hypothetical protein [Deltaproteobacteria bacterium]
MSNAAYDDRSDPLRPSQLLGFATKLVTDANLRRVAVFPKDSPVVDWLNAEFTTSDRPTPPKSDAGPLLFRPDAGLASSAEVLRFAESRPTGIVLGPDRMFHATYRAGSPKPAVKVRFLALPFDSVGDGEAHYPFVSREDGKMIVPMIDMPRLNGRAFSDKELRRLGLEFITDPSGAPLEYVALWLASRSVLLLTRAALGLEEYQPGVPYAWQFKGVGTKRYRFHLVGRKAATDGNTNPKDVLLQGVQFESIRSSRFGHRAEYDGVSGILLDIVHAPDSPAPEGAYMPDEAEERYRLLRRGGTLTARCPVATARLLRRDDSSGVDLTGMLAEQLVVPCEAWIDAPSTLRLSDIISRGGEKVSAEMHFLGTALALAEVFDIERGQFGLEAECARDSLERIVTRCGANARSALGAKLTIAWNWNLAANITWGGAALDYGDYRPAWWGEFGSLVYAHLVVLFHLCTALGSHPSTIWTSSSFGGLFFRAFLNGDAARRASEVARIHMGDVGASSEDDEGPDQSIAAIAAYAVTEWMLSRSSTVWGEREITIDARGLIEHFSTHYPTLVKSPSAAELRYLVACGRQETVEAVALQLLPTYLFETVLANFNSLTSGRRNAKPPVSEYHR